MSAVVGIDVSTRALDLVKLDEDSNRAEWVRCELAGADAWARTLDIREALWRASGDSFYRWLEDVYLVAIEEPRGRGQLRTNALLNRVVGAVAASLPARLRVPERCWVVRPDEVRSGLGLKHNVKATPADLERLTGTRYPFTGSEFREPASEDARDAFCIAWWAREQIAKASAA